MAVIDLERLSVGRRLRTLRAAAGLSQYELAVKAGLLPGRLSELEKERRAGSAIEWQKLSAALGIPIGVTAAE